MKNFEIIKVDEFEVTFDVSNLTENRSLFLNATQIAKQFGKIPRDWLRNAQTQEYIESVARMENSPFEDLIKITKGGTNQGTWIHNFLAVAFLRWLNPIFAYSCDKVIKKMLDSKNKNIEYIISGYKSQIAQHNSKIKELKDELRFYETRNVIPASQFEAVVKNKDEKIKELENKLVSLPLFNKEKKIDIMLQRTNDLINKENTRCSFTEALRTHLIVYSEYIEALRVGGDKLEQYCINEIEKYKKEKNEAREKEVKMVCKYNNMIDRIKGFIKASNEIALLEAV